MSASNSIFRDLIRIGGGDLSVATRRLDAVHAALAGQKQVGRRAISAMTSTDRADEPEPSLRDD